MNSQVANKTALIILGAVCISFAFAPPSQAGQACTGTSPYVCVYREDITPVEDTHFSFDASDPDFVDAIFRTGHSTNAWHVWSQVSSGNTTPDDLGDLFIDSTSSTDSYKVEIENPNNGNAGAVNLGSAVLDDTTSWTGLSSITDGRITGDLTGDLEAVASGGSGGALNLTIEGDAQVDLPADFSSPPIGLFATIAS